MHAAGRAVAMPFPAAEQPGGCRAPVSHILVIRNDPAGRAAVRSIQQDTCHILPLPLGRGGGGEKDGWHFESCHG